MGHDAAHIQIDLSELELERPWQLSKSRPKSKCPPAKESSKSHVTLSDAKRVCKHHSSNQSQLTIDTVNTNYYLKRMIIAWIRTPYDTLTQGRPVQMHASGFDVEKATATWNQAIQCKSRPVRIGLPTLCWCILLVVCAIQFLMYLDSLLILLHNLGLGPS